MSRKECRDIYGLINILEVAVDALGRTALVVTDILGEFIAGKPFGTGFGLGLRLAAAALIGLDDWNMPERAALCRDFRRIISAVHEVVEIGDAAGRDGRQG